MDFPFTQSIWVKASKVLNFNWRWNGENFELALQNWVSNKVSKTVMALPLLVSLGVWISWIKSIFQDTITMLTLVVVQVIGVLSHFPQSKELQSPIRYQPIKIDYGKPWGFFDGSTQGDLLLGGNRVVLFLLEISNYIYIKYGLGPSTNNHT